MIPAKQKDVNALLVLNPRRAAWDGSLIVSDQLVFML
jgi:hypothetical protein